MYLDNNIIYSRIQASSDLEEWANSKIWAAETKQSQSNQKQSAKIKSTKKRVLTEVEKQTTKIREHEHESIDEDSSFCQTRS